MNLRLRRLPLQRAGILILVACCAHVAQAEIDLRLHVAWGGGEARQWQGRATIPGGRTRDLVVLGMDADEPGSILMHSQAVLIDQRRPRTYDGFEVSVAAPRTATLRIELLSVGEATPRTIDVPLEKLVGGYHSESLDTSNNRLVIRRAPGDDLRLRFRREHLVFAPGELFQLDVVPHELNVSPHLNVRCSMALRRARQRTNLWEQARTIRADSLGQLPPWEACQIQIPDEQGVYDLEVSLTSRRLTAAFAGDRLIASRRLQLVVVGRAAEPAESEPMRLLADLDPTQRNWWQRMTRLPQWSLLPGLRSEGPLGNADTERINLGGRDWTQLPASEWQAYPLPIDELGAEHELEVDFPANVAQAFAISIIEPNAAGKVIPVGLDSGVQITDDQVHGVAANPPQVGSHRLVFWPKTKSPLVLVSNLRKDAPAIFGRFRVYRRGTSPALPATPWQGRQVYASFERPLFPEIFSASESLDGETGRSLEDWKTFWDGGERLVRHLKSAGYNGAVITSASEGSTLYPSRVLQPTPKHDRGVFYSSGQDAVRKDVLEMLFRICDREGIVLVPAIEFSTPLPALERLRWQSPKAAEGIDLVNAEGLTWVEQHGSKRGNAPYYNPLNDKVQEQMMAAVREIAARYADHPSFKGVTITLRDDGFTQLPGAEWGLDADTIERFRRETGASASPELALRHEMAYGKRRDEWLTWRARMLAQFYHRLGRELQRYKPDSKLFLAGGRLVESRPIQRAFRPALPRQAKIDQAMIELGIAADHFQDGNIVLLRPQIHAYSDTPTRQGTYLEFSLADEVDEYFRDHAATQFLHEPHRVRLPTFDEVSPFGRANTMVSLVAHILPVGQMNRQRFARAVSSQDTMTIFEGGWMLPLGQEESLRDFFAVFRQLPAQPFQDVQLANRSVQPLKVRRLETSEATFVYVVNESPWATQATLHFDVGPEITFLRLGRDAEPPRLEYPSGQAIWNLNLQPYALVAVRIDGKAQIRDVRVKVPAQVFQSLQRRIESLGSRAARLRNPPALELLRNAGFNESMQGAKIPGWNTASMAGISLQTTDAFEGRSALRIRASSTSRLLLSDPVKPPDSGRLSIAVRAKAVDPSRQPRVRFVLRANDTTYYPWAPIGAAQPESSLRGDWKEFVFRVSHLPPIIGSSLSIGIEVSGQGDVLIDDVRVLDILALDDTEQIVLAQILSRADFQLRNGLVRDCLRSLNGYWPQYLMQNVPEVGPEPTMPPQRTATIPQERPSRPGTLDRLKQLIPGLR